MKVLTNMTAVDASFKGEVGSLVSKTVPDQALTPQELLRKFASGLPVGVHNSMIYDSDCDVEVPDFNKMDKLDRLHSIQENKDRIDSLYTDLSDSKKKAEAKRKSVERSKAKVISDKVASASDNSETV